MGSLGLAYKYRNSYKPGEEDRGGVYRGTNFVPNAQLQEERTNQQAMNMQELKNRGALDPVKYQQDATTDRFGQKLEYDKTTGLRDFKENQRVGDRDFGQRKLEQGRRFGLDIRKSDQDFWQSQRDFKQNKLEQDRNYEFKLFETKYKNKADEKKAWDAEIDSLVNPQFDKSGMQIPGTGQYSYKDAVELLKNKQRLYNEIKDGNAVRGPGGGGESAATDDVYASQGADGTKSYSNVPTADQGSEVYEDQPGGLSNYEAQQVPKSNARSTYDKVGGALNQQQPEGQSRRGTMSDRLGPARDILRALDSTVGSAITKNVRKLQNKSLFN